LHRFRIFAFEAHHRHYPQETFPMRAAFGALLILCVSNQVRAEDTIPLETLQAIKSATAFVKVEAGSFNASGSGFLMKVDGETAYVVTNHHVIDPSVEITVPDMPRRPRPPITPRLRPPIAPPSSGSRTVTITVKNPNITVVFWSGTKVEKSVRAEMVASDSERDLAALRVKGVADLPKPIDFSQMPKLIETMPVYVFGFPFGNVLSTSKGNPAITVGKGAVSSIRLNDKGDLAMVQIDGALNPGNSGGPVVDAGGRLVGVAVATIKGSSGIGRRFRHES
jgi:S1-C subfamily serine protease